MKSMSQMAHDFLALVCHSQAICLDGTLGRGRDAAFFLQQGCARVLAFEIQPDIAKSTQDKLDDPRLTVFAESHANLFGRISEVNGRLDAAVFNFGYDPASMSGIHTHADSSCEAVRIALSFLRLKGRMALVFYEHPEGQKEARQIVSLLSSLQSSLDILFVRHPFKENAPWLALIEKRHGL